MEYQLVPMTECGDTNKDGAVPTKTQENLPSNEITEHKKMLKNVWLPLLRILATANLVLTATLVAGDVSDFNRVAALYTPGSDGFSIRYPCVQCDMMQVSIMIGSLCIWLATLSMSAIGEDTVITFFLTDIIVAWMGGQQVGNSFVMKTGCACLKCSTSEVSSLTIQSLRWLVFGIRISIILALLAWSWSKGKVSEAKSEKGHMQESAAVTVV